MDLSGNQNDANGPSCLKTSKTRKTTRKTEQACEVSTTRNDTWWNAHSAPSQCRYVFTQPRPVSNMSIAGHRPAILLYSIQFPEHGVHLERARRAATGSYSGGGCRGLLPLNRDRR